MSAEVGLPATRRGQSPRRYAASAGPSSSALPFVDDLHALGALSGLAVLLAAWGYPLWGGAWDVLCPLRELTGTPCPTCFGTRALVAAAAGQWLTALRFNPLVAVGGIGLLAYVPWAAATVVGGWPRPRMSPAYAKHSVRVAFVLVLANWAYLIVAHT